MLKRGDILKNRYTVKQVLKSGDRTCVYIVEDSQMMKEWVMKEFIIQIENPMEINLAIQKFEREVTILAGLKHAGIPEMVDYFTIVDRQYLIMEYVQGKSLEKILEESFQPLYEPDVLRIGIQIAGILHFLHRQTPPILFRDLCPSNIMITPDNMVKLVDFGLGRHFRSIREINAKKLGTPGYAPPEQFGRDEFNERTDIYALGAIIHQMLTLKDPTELSNVFKFSSIKESNPKASVRIDEIVNRATRYDPSERYFSALEMKREMESLLSRRTEGPKAPPSAPETKKKSRTTSEEIVSFPDHMGARKNTSKIGTKRVFSDKSKKILLICSIATLVLIFVVLSIYYAITISQKKSKKGSDSPFTLPIDKKVSEIRDSAIKHYNRGFSNGDMSELAISISEFKKVITANPWDVPSQVYLENASILMQNQPYVKIAVLFSLSGSNSESGFQLLSGVSLAQVIHNSTEGKGKKILIEIFDDKSKQEECIKLASELGKRKDILAVIGPNRSPFLETTAPFFNNGKIVQISPTGTCTDRESLGQFIFRMVGDGKDLAINMADTSINRLGLKRIAVVYDPTDSYSKVIGELYDREVRKAGKAEIRAFNAMFDSMDYSSTLKDIKEYGPDGVFFVAYQDQEARFAIQMRKMGIKAQLLATVAVYSPQLIALGGKAVEGIIFNTYFHPGLDSPEAKKFVDNYKKKFNDIEPNFRAALAYDSTIAISAALNNDVMNPISLESFLKEKLGKELTLKGTTGPIEFDKQGRRTKLNLSLMTVRNGNFETYLQEESETEK